MTTREFIGNINSFDGNSRQQKNLYIALVLNPNQSNKELAEKVGCSSGSINKMKMKIVEKGLKIEPIDEIEDSISNQIAAIENEQNTKIAAKDKIIINMSDIYTQQPLELKSFTQFSTYPLVKINYKNNPIVLQIKHGKLNIKIENENDLDIEDLKEFCNIDLNK